jgi:hypothetical protein
MIGMSATALELGHELVISYQKASGCENESLIQGRFRAYN